MLSVLVLNVTSLIVFFWIFESLYTPVCVCTFLCDMSFLRPCNIHTHTHMLSTSITSCTSIEQNRWENRREGSHVRSSTSSKFNPLQPSLPRPCQNHSDSAKTHTGTHTPLLEPIHSKNNVTHSYSDKHAYIHIHIQTYTHQPHCLPDGRPMPLK